MPSLSERPPHPPKTVLVVTRFPDPERFLTQALGRAGFRPSVVSAECVLRGNLYLPSPPSLVLVTPTMKAVQAFRVFGALEANEELRSIPTLRIGCSERSACRINFRASLREADAPLEIADLGECLWWEER